MFECLHKKNKNLRENVRENIYVNVKVRNIENEWTTN